MTSVGAVAASFPERASVLARKITLTSRFLSHSDLATSSSLNQRGILCSLFRLRLKSRPICTVAPMGNHRYVYGSLPPQAKLQGVQGIRPPFLVGSQDSHPHKLKVPPGGFLLGAGAFAPRTSINGAPRYGTPRAWSNCTAKLKAYSAQRLGSPVPMPVYGHTDVVAAMTKV